MNILKIFVVILGDDEKQHLNLKKTLDQTFCSSQSNKNGSHSKDKSQTLVNNSLTENIYAGICFTLIFSI